MARQYGHKSEIADKVREELILEQEEANIRKRKIERIVTFAIFGIGVIFLISGVVSANNFKNKMAEAHVNLQTAQAKLEEWEAKVENTPKTVIEQEIAHANATDVGKAVCDAQNALNKATKAEREANLDTLSADHQEALNNLRSYLPKDRGNSSLARGTWCLYGTWEFDSVYDFTGTKVDIVWKCYNPSNKSRLLAFATASYDSTTNMLSNTTVYRTTWYDSYADANGEIVTADEGTSYTGGSDPIYDSNGNLVQPGSDSPSSSSDTAPVAGDQSGFDSGDAYNSSTGGTN